jgi:hypothetical protein
VEVLHNLDWSVLLPLVLQVVRRPPVCTNKQTEFGQGLTNKNTRCYKCTKIKIRHRQDLSNLKVPKREIFDSSDSPDFYTIKSSWVGDLLVKILTYYFNFWESQAAFSF